MASRFQLAVLALCLLSPLVSTAQTSAAETQIASFTSGVTPVSSLVHAADGNFYGVTYEGGANGLGSIYRVTQGASTTTLYSFTGSADGGLPASGIVQGVDGKLYGTTLVGGANGFGTLYSISLAGQIEVLHSFDSAVDGNSPNGTLALGSDGTLYGTLAGGAYDAATQAYAGGTIFSLGTDGTYTNLYSFPADGSLGSVPASRLVQASDGNLWGSTSSDGANGYGTLFRYNLSAGTLSKMYDLAVADGMVLNGLVEQNSVLYGVTFPGVLDNGEIFALSLNGNFSVVYTFSGTATDGGMPATALYPGSDGQLYGITQSGGAYGTGTFFVVGPSRTPVTLFSFPAGTMNTLADGALLEATDGSFYVPVEFDATAGLQINQLDGAGYLFRLAPNYSSTPAPPVALTMTPSTPIAGKPATLSWSASNAGSDTAGTCVAGGAWSGIKPPSGSTSVTLPAGSASYTLTCGGSVSNTLTVTAQNPSLTITLTGPSSVTQGQNASLAVTATAGSGWPTPTGSVTYVVNNSLSLATLALSNGKASLTASADVPAGTYSAVANYSGDSNYAAAKSNTISVTVVSSVAATQTVLTASPNPVPHNGTATLAATVSRKSGSGSPTGTVQFWCENLLLGQAALSSGTARLTASAKGVAAGKYPVVAKYLGDSGDSASASGVLYVTAE